MTDEEMLRLFRESATRNANGFQDDALGLRAVQRAVALEAVTVVHDHFNDADLCEPVEAALERHFGFIEGPSIQK